MPRNTVFSERQANDVKSSHVDRKKKMQTSKMERCSTFENGKKLALWMNSVTEDTESSLSSSNDFFLKHLRSNCTCIDKAGVELLIGCNFYQLFLLRFKKFNCSVSNCESKLSIGDVTNDKSEENNASSHDSTGTSTTSPYSNSDANKPSKYENEIFGHIVNKSSCEKIINPLKTAIHYWEEAIRPKKSVDPTVLLKLQIAYNLIGCYYIFESFDVIAYKHKSAKLLLSITLLMNQPGLQLHAYYLLIQAYIQTGALSKAYSYLKTAERVLERFNLKKTQTFETWLIFLAQCEVGLYLGKAELYAKELMEFIVSDYLQRMTLNRYLLKGLALTLAAKFPSNIYNFSATYQEFIEPSQVAICILKRWHRSYFPMAQDSKRKDEDMSSTDPVWYKFAVYDFSFKAYKSAASFYINSGSPVDLAFFHNALLKIGRQNCFLLWNVKLLVFGAEIDLMCDKREPAIIKLNVAAAMYINISNYSISESGSFDSNDAINCHQVKLNSWSGFKNTNLDTENTVITASPKPNLSYTQDECAHDHEIPVWSLRNMLLKNRKQNSDDFFNSDEVFLKSDEHSSMTDDKDDGYVRFNFLKHDVYSCLSLLQDAWKHCLPERLEELYSKLTANITSAYVAKLSDAMGVDSTEIDNFFYVLDSTTFHLKLINYLSEAYVKCGNYSKIITLSEALLPQCKKFVFGVEMRTLLANLIFKYTKAKFGLYNKQSLVVEYNVSVMDEVCNSDIRSDCKTPSPKSGKTKQIAPRAPKGKNEFKMDEFEDYFKGLSQASEKESNVKTTKLGDQRKSKFDSESKESIASERKDDIDDILKMDAIYSARKISGKRTILRSISKCNELTEIESKPILKSAKNCGDVTETDTMVKSNLMQKDFPSFKSIICFEDLRTTLHSLLRLFGNHPPCQLYRDINFLLFQIISTNHCNDEAAHYFSEATTASSIRYRNILLSEKKQKNSLTVAINLESCSFNPDVDTDPSFLKGCLSDLPSSWRICQLHAVANNTAIPDIYVARFQPKKKTLFLKIKGNSEIFLQDFMSELYQIIELSNASITNKDAVTFWKVRHALDNRFKCLMNAVDDKWFGPFKGLFMGQILDKAFCEMCTEMKSKILQLFEKLTCKDDSLLDMIVESYAFQTDDQFMFSIFTLFGNKAIARNCVKECEKIFHRYYPIDDKSTFFENLKTEPMALIVNKPLITFPFETLPTPVLLKQEIFRVPSIRFLSTLYKKFNNNSSIYSNGIDPKSVYYLLNPTNNLPKTEGYFKEKFLKQSNWNGVIGSAPDGTLFKKYLESRDLYIFFGHGAGSSYYRSLPDGLEGAAIKCASLVIGCCSGKLISDGESFEPYGIPWRFILNGSPSYLGILWDVTDRDIDRFADKLLQNLLPNWSEVNKWQPLSVCNAVIHSRDVCKLKYLIGASPVVYGLPISAFKQ